MQKKTANPGEENMTELNQVNDLPRAENISTSMI